MGARGLSERNLSINPSRQDSSFVEHSTTKSCADVASPFEKTHELDSTVRQRRAKRKRLNSWLADSSETESSTVFIKSSLQMVTFRLQGWFVYSES